MSNQPNLELMVEASADEVLIVRLTAKEKEILKKEASKKGETMSKYVRRALISSYATK